MHMKGFSLAWLYLNVTPAHSASATLDHTVGGRLSMREVA